jgi:hypothetical protein
MYHHTDNSVSHAVCGVIFGGLFFFRGMKLWQNKRDIENKPLSKVRGVAMGDAELSGQVLPEQAIKAPFSGKDCVYCSYAVEVPARNGWNRVDHGQDTSIFYLDDGTGRILVNPDGATFFGPHTYQKEFTGTAMMSEPGIAAWLTNQRQKSLLGSLSTYGRHRFTEYAVLPGETIFVEGAVSTARHVVQGREREDLIIGPRASGHLVLSALSEKDLLAEFAWKVPLQVLGGGSLLLGCLWYLAWYFHL